MSLLAHTLGRNERLRGKRAISDLFGNGSVFFIAPYKVFWTKVPDVDGVPSQFAISAPKRRFKRAVKRNLIKRRTREVFRVNKQILNDVVNSGQQIHLMLIYASDRLIPVSELDTAMKKILKCIACKYAESV